MWTFLLGAAVALAIYFLTKRRNSSITAVLYAVAGFAATVIIAPIVADQLNLNFLQDEEKSQMRSQIAGTPSFAN